jgi:serine/threonine protein kinase
MTAPSSLVAELDVESRTLPKSVARALDEELTRLEDLRAQGWLVLAVLLLSASSLAAVFVAADIARPGLIGSFALIAWFIFVRRAIAKGKLRAWHKGITLVIEVVAPWLMLVGIVQGATPAIALAAWGPLLFFAGIMILTLLRLDARQAFVCGVLGGVQYLVIALLLAQPKLTPELQQEFSFTTGSILVRGVFLSLSGVLCAFVSRGLRRAFGAAVRIARARDLFGKYQLERELASGGMGSVWLATYAPEGGFRRPAAVKRIHPHLARDEKFVDAFRKEAELGARLVHHNIVQTLDFGRIDDAYFLAMEYVDGCSCAELSRRATTMGIALPPRVVARIIRDVLAGLVYAHEEARDIDGTPLRVVHRDLAPQNVLVSTAGLVKITDFGIARTLRDSTAALTQAVGHAGHVAPEHIDGKPIDARSDLFLVGVLAWELLAARPLFVRDNEMATLSALLLAPAQTIASIDGKLAPWDALLQRALAKDPKERHASAREMAAHLDALIAASDGPGVASAVELGGLVRSLEGKDVHDALTMPLGGKLGTPSNDVTSTTGAA